MTQVSNKFVIRCWNEPVVRYLREEEYARPELPAHLRPILEQLAMGVTDATASRNLHISARTFSRRVAEVLTFLGVATRFQGGMAAVRLDLSVPALPYEPIEVCDFRLISSYSASST